MVMNGFSLTRRQTLAGLTASTALTLGGCSTISGPSALRDMTVAPDEWLDQVAFGMLQYEPERATALGVDTGEYAPLRSKLEDQSIEGQREYAAYLRWVVTQMEGLDESGLTPDQQTSFQVVRSAFATAAANALLERMVVGSALPSSPSSTSARKRSRPDDDGSSSSSSSSSSSGSRSSGRDSKEVEPQQKYSVYAVAAAVLLGFTHLHPFKDGNGRLGRLLANVPCDVSYRLRQL
mgnify:CR=1 FL=1